MYSWYNLNNDELLGGKQACYPICCSYHDYVWSSKQVWSTFSHHSHTHHWRNILCYVWNNNSCWSLQPSVCGSQLDSKPFRSWLFNILCSCPSEGNYCIIFITAKFWNNKMQEFLFILRERMIDVKIAAVGLNISLTCDNNKQYS